MLTREVEAGADTCSQEDFMVVVIMLKSFIQLSKALSIVNIATCDIAEFEEGMQRLDHLVRDISLYCW